MTIFARSGEPGRADPLFDEVAKSIVAASGWHGWLWRLRLSQAKAELALARRDWPEAIEAATKTITDSEARSRLKYVAVGLIARAEAHFAEGNRPQALADATRAVEVARQYGDPVVLLKALVVQIQIDGTDELAQAAHNCRQQILNHIDDARLRERFVSSALGR